MKHWVWQEQKVEKKDLFGQRKIVTVRKKVQVDGPTYRAIKRLEKEYRKRERDEEWQRRYDEDLLEEEYDEIDGIEDADY